MNIWQMLFAHFKNIVIVMSRWWGLVCHTWANRADMLISMMMTGNWNGKWSKSTSWSPKHFWGLIGHVVTLRNDGIYFSFSDHLLGRPETETDDISCVLFAALVSTIFHSPCTSWSREEVVFRIFSLPNSMCHPFYFLLSASGSSNRLNKCLLLWDDFNKFQRPPLLEGLQ